MAGTQMKQRRDTAAGWNTNNRVLGAGEIGLETDTRKVKFGDGTTPWNALQYINYLPLDGKAANADKLDGFDSSEFVFANEVTEAATALKIPRRTADGGLRVTAANENDEATTLAQLTAGVVSARQRSIIRSVAASTNLASSDAGGIVSVANAAYTSTLLVNLLTDAVAPMAIGTTIDICSSGIGPVNVAPASGVTIRGSYQGLDSYSTLRLLKIATNEWIVLHRKDENFPTLRRKMRLSFAVPSGAFTLLPLDGVNNSTGGFAYSNNYDSTISSAQFTAASSVYRAVCRRAGWYRVFARYNVTPTNSQRFFLRFAVNDLDVWFGGSSMGGGQQEMGPSATATIALNLGDFVTATAYQDTGATLFTSDSPYAPSFFEWMWARPL